MGNNAQNPGRNNNQYLPKVGPGDVIRPTHINDLSDAVDRNRLVQGLGGLVQQTPTGTFVTVSRYSHKPHPWKCSSVNDEMFITTGQFFYNRAGAGGVNQVTNGELLAGGRNAWFFQATKEGVDAWSADNLPDGFWMGGAEIWFEDPTANFLTNKQNFIGTDTIRCKKQEGLYYLEVAPWGGRQMTVPYPDPGSNPAFNAANDQVEVWNAYSAHMTGKTVPQLRFAPRLGEEMFAIKRFVYPIATVNEQGQIFQGISSDIFHIAPPPQPFEVSLLKDGTTWKAYVNPGMVNGVVPKIGSKYLDDGVPPYVTVTGAGRIYLKATNEARKFFPKLVEVGFVSGDVPPEDTENNGYYQIASISTVGTNYVVTQLSYGNKVLNRFKMGATGAYWVWSA